MCWRNLRSFWRYPSRNAKATNAQRFASFSTLSVWRLAEEEWDAS